MFPKASIRDQFVKTTCRLVRVFVTDDWNIRGSKGNKWNNEDPETNNSSLKTLSATNKKGLTESEKAVSFRLPKTPKPRRLSVQKRFPKTLQALCSPTMVEPGVLTGHIESYVDTTRSPNEQVRAHLPSAKKFSPQFEVKFVPFYCIFLSNAVFLAPANMWRLLVNWDRGLCSSEWKIEVLCLIL